MLNNLQNALESLFSEARFTPYRRNNESFENTFQRYQWNIRLGEAMLPSLHYLEVCLRNRVDLLIRQHFGQNWLLEPPVDLGLSEVDKRKLTDTVQRFQREQHNRTILQDDMVSRMNFGFWYAFFHRRYDPILWQRRHAIISVFPNLSREQRTRKFIEPLLRNIKELRNRIAHHEPVWNMAPSVIDVHGNCLTLIAAMSTEALIPLRDIDRFPQVWNEAI
jgi:hypothetical protein